MRVIIGADHGGFETKERLKRWLLAEDYEIEDVGAEKLDLEDDFVDYAKAVAEKLNAQDWILDMGILLCRNGVGVSIVANRFKRVRCCLGFDEGQVRRARSDDNVNCLALPADYIDFKRIKRLVKIFLEVEFGGGQNYIRRIKKIESL